MNASSVFLPYVNFLLFVGIVWWFGRKPLNELAGSKLKEFEHQVNNAHKAKAEAEKALEASTRELEALAQELASMKAQAHRDIEQERAKTIVQSDVLASQIIEEARRHIEEEVAEAIKQLQTDLLKKAKQKATGQIKGQLAHATKEKYFQKQSELFALRK